MELPELGKTTTILGQFQLDNPSITTKIRYLDLGNNNNSVLDSPQTGLKKCMGMQCRGMHRDAVQASLSVCVRIVALLFRRLRILWQV